MRAEAFADLTAPATTNKLVTNMTVKAIAGTKANTAPRALTISSASTAVTSPRGSIQNNSSVSPCGSRPVLPNGWTARRGSAPGARPPECRRWEEGVSGRQIRQLSPGEQKRTIAPESSVQHGRRAGGRRVEPCGEYEANWPG